MLNTFLNLSPVFALVSMGWQIVEFFSRLTAIHQASIDAALTAASVK